MNQWTQNTLKYWCKVFLITLLVMLFVRSFLVQSYTVSSVQMEASLLDGDRVLVNKLAYGVRMPITPLANPFSFDSVCGFRSYSTAIQLGYERLFCSKVNKNDVVVFNNPLEISKPLDKRSLCLSRCVGQPGDTIGLNGFEFKVNGKSYPMSPNRLLDFEYPASLADTLTAAMKELNIKKQNYSQTHDVITLSLNRYDAYLLNQSLGANNKLLQSTPQDNINYKIEIPKRGEMLTLTAQNMPFYLPIIMSEQGAKVHFDGLSLYIDGVKKNVYCFQSNYYWLLSDNVNQSVDSRQLGLISERNIIGKATTILYSIDRSGKIRWHRFLSSVS